ncbi:MAG: stage III sporulation protein AD [Tyzzerella sp.]|uniref:Stage III sporulation protein AD n=1 Tax=Candidatus Fimicola merdigallinarum TaxID=2840819 RepID=A0A9D9DXH0_9FIRM|nr:stage III sporulation protein AD [Candidatus Fimicola merdigallinarum]
MDIIRIVSIGVIGTFIALSIKNYSKEFSILVAMITGILIVFQILEILTESIVFIESVYERTGLDFLYMRIVMKVIAVAYISEFAIQICKDAEFGSIASKIELGGKLIILSLSIPIIKAILDTVTSLLA